MRGVFAMGMVLLAGCGTAPDAARHDSVSDTTAGQTQPDSSPPAIGGDSTSGFGPAGEWVVTPRRAGPMRFGMTHAEAMSVLQPVDTILGDGCEYTKPANGPGGLSVMINDGRMSRVDVSAGTVATREGARIGDSEARILALYPGSRREPHAYAEGAYLVVTPHAPADTIHRYVFEINDARVTQFRAGIHPEVGYVEGCL